jgi:dolichol-phosphate mannosyltransferase
MAMNPTCELVSIVIPVFNEEAGVAQLKQRLVAVRAAWDRADELEFVFVDDGSSDRTGALLREIFANEPRVRVLVHERNRGIGAAFRTGFQECQGSIVCTIDADCSYGPENLQKLVAVIKAGRGDIAVASPYHPEGAVEGVPRWRLVLSRGCSGLYGLIAPVRLYTYTSVFRAYRGDVIRTVRFEEDGFVSASEILIRAAEAGYRIVEVPMTLHSRKIGQTKMKVVRTIRGHLRLIANTTARRLLTVLHRPVEVTARTSK